jgi:hypothetical protein
MAYDLQNLFTEIESLLTIFDLPCPRGKSLKIRYAPPDPRTGAYESAVVTLRAE